MKALLANPYVARLGGALGAGVTTYLATHDVKSAILTAVTFVVYGTVHSSASQESK